MTSYIATLLLCLAQNPPVATQAKDAIDQAKPKVTVEGQAPQVEVSKPTVTKPSVTKPKKPKLKRPSATAGTDAVKLKAMKIPSGSPVSVVNASGTKISGTLTDMTNDGISVRSVQDGRIVNQKLPYADVRSLKKGRKPKFRHGLASPKTLDTSLAQIPAGAPVEATLADKSTVAGRFAGKTADGVSLQIPQGDQMTTRTIPLDQIASIKQPKKKLPGMPKLQSPDMVKKSLSGIPAGSPVNVNMPGGAQLSGKMLGMTDKGFSMQTLEGGNLVTKNLTFDQVASVKPPSYGVKGKIPGLHPPALQTPAKLKTAALALPAGSPLTLAMPDGGKISGKLMGVTNDGVQVQAMQNGDVVTQTLGFDQIGSIKKGLPVTKMDRLKGVSKSAVTIAVTSAITGLIASKI